MEIGGVAVVTGGANGIGRATCLALAARGCDVVIADVDLDAGAALAREIGPAARFVPTDVASRTAIEAMAGEAIDWRGHCDLVISNAAIGGRGAPHEFSVDDWETMIRVDLMASIWVMRAFLPHLLGRDRGHLSLVSSGAGLQGIADDAPYAVAKWGLIGLAESFAAFVRGTGVSTSVILPGAVGDDTHVQWRTMRVAAATPAEAERVRADHRATMQHWPPPESMAADLLEQIEAGRFYIFQRATGEHEDWAMKLMQQKWADPDAFVRGNSGPTAHV